MKSVEYITKHLDRIKEGVSKGHIFKTPPDPDQRFQLCIFQMLKGSTEINDKYLHDLYQRENKLTINFNNRKRLIALWQKEIDEHNKNLFANQRTLL